MDALRAAGLEDVARVAAVDDRPFLGICVGMQMLFEGSDESPGTSGLAVLPGRVELLPSTRKLPQMGWNTLEARDGSRLLAGLPDPAWCYFVHSYAVISLGSSPNRPPGGESVAAWCEYGARFVAAVEVRPMWATQFHPEKSGRVGLAVLENFVKACAG